MKQFDFMKDPDNNGKESITIERTSKRKVDIIPRVICLLLALGIWIYMFNMNDADTAEEITLRIELSGEDVLYDEGMMVYGFDERSVTVTVKGTNRDLKKFSESDYKAVVDVIGITEAKVNNLPITIKVPANSSITVVSTTPGNVPIISDYREEKTVGNIGVTFGSVSEGSFVGELSVGEITVSGPREIVSKIARVDFIVDGEIEHNDTISNFTTVKYYSSDDKEIDTRGAIKVLTKEISITVFEETTSAESGSLETESTTETE